MNDEQKLQNTIETPEIPEVTKEEMFVELDDLVNAHKEILQTGKDDLEERRLFEQFLVEHPELLGWQEVDDYHFNMSKSEAFVKKAEGILEGIQKIVTEIKDQLKDSPDDVWVDNDQFEELKKQNSRFMKAMDNASKYWEAADENYTIVLRMVTNAKKAEIADLEEQLRQLKRMSR